MKAADMLEYHSGGKVSAALRMSLASSTLPISQKMMTIQNDNTVSTNQLHRELGNIKTAGSSFEKGIDDEIDEVHLLLPPPQKKGSYCCFRC